jgi:hypothetical protein
LRTPRTSRQQQQNQQQQQLNQQQQQQQDRASAGTLLRERLMQGMGEEERVLLLKALTGL